MVSTTGQAETITADELTWVLSRHGSHLDATALIGEIRDRRDCGYEQGVMYQDPEGNVWQFDYPLAPGEAFWLRPGIERTFTVGVPRRPLRRLVPLPARDDIYGTLALGIGRESADELTDRIVRLLEGTDEH